MNVQDMEVMGKLKILKRLRYMSSFIMWHGKDRLIRKTKTEMIDHILESLCKCELNEKGRQYLIKLKNDISGT